MGGRIGFLDMPKATTGSLQAGYTLPIVNEQVLIDVDAQAGAMFAGARNLMFDLYQMESITPMFGLTLSAGTDLREPVRLRLISLDNDRIKSVFLRRNALH